jgi:hypothetical protein
MYDTLEIGPTPCEEKCEQLGPNYSPRRARRECERFIEAIKFKCGEPPEGAVLRIASHQHDYGTYYEVAVKYDSDIPEATAYALKVESEAPNEWQVQVGQETRDFTPIHEEPPTGKPRYWVGSFPKCDIPGCDVTDLTAFVDGKTRLGPWGNMCPGCWIEHGVGRLGTGFGQRYEKQADGRFLKVE